MTQERQAGPAAFDIGVAHLGDTAARVILDRTRRLEKCDGVTRAWIADERFMHDPWVLLGGCAAVTERLSLGPCVTDPFIRHPALTANAAATLDDLSRGRAVLGLGAGATGFTALGLDHARPVTALREAVDLSRRLWNSSGPVSYVGTSTRFVDGRLNSAPRREIPIYIAARGPKVLAAAAQVASVVLLGNFLGGPGLNYALSVIRSAAVGRDADLPPLRLAAWAYLSVDDDANAARDATKPGVVMAVRTSLPVLTRAGLDIPTQLSDAVNSLPNGRLSNSAIHSLARLVPDHLVDDLAIAGTPTECARRIRELRGQGIHEIAVLPYAPAGRRLDDVLDEFMSDVVPLCFAT